MSRVRVVGHLERAALRKIGKLEDQGFHFCRFEAVGPNATLLSGGPCRTLQRGPNRGKVRVSSITHRIVVTDEEVELEVAAYERDTGLCGACMGRGQETAGWSAADGEKLRPCAHCLKTGKAVGR